MYFAVGDPHGCYEELREILKNWDEENDTLILLGDLTDSGPRSLECLKLAIELSKRENVIVIGGNHEEIFIEWLEMEGEEEFYYIETFDNTIRSFFSDELGVLNKYTKTYIAERIKSLYPDVIEFMRTRPLYYETENLIFVHAGISGKKEWKETADNDCKYIRSKFIYGKNETGKKVVFGHTPTENMHQDKSNEIWISSCGTKIGIDGGCVFGGQLNAIRIDDNGEIVNTYSVKKKLK